MPLPAAPVFFLGQTLTKRDLLAPVGAARQAGGERPPGLLLSWDHVHAEGVDEGAADAAPLDPVLADPGATRYGRDTIQRKDAAPWIQRRAPKDDYDWTALIDEALAAQRALSAPAHIIPSVTLTQTDWPDGVQVALDAARRAAKQRPQGDPEAFVRVTVDDPWITDARFRRTLLNQVTDLPEDLEVALHVRWSRSAALGDEACVANLRTVVEALAGDGRRVLMVEAGALGWLAIGWGAWGFTAGLAQSTWLRSTEQIRRSKGQPATRVEWYFEPRLLHRVRRATHQRLAGRSDYQPCSCAFCQRLVPGGAGTWDLDLAAQHALYSLAALTDQVAAPRLADRHARVLAAVRDAQAYADNLGLRGEPRPAHLQAWLNQL